MKFVNIDEGVYYLKIEDFKSEVALKTHNKPTKVRVEEYERSSHLKPEPELSKQS